MELGGSLPSTRPYLIRAMHQWCCDHGFTPHLSVAVTPAVRVPMEYVREGQIVLNVSLSATQGLDIGNDGIVFKARFGGVPRELYIPVDCVLSIFARENGQGMAFPAPSEVAVSEPAQDAAPPAAPGPRLSAVPSPSAARQPSKPSAVPAAQAPSAPAAPDEEPPPTPPPSSPRPALKRVK